MEDSLALFAFPCGVMCAALYILTRLYRDMKS